MNLNYYKINGSSIFRIKNQLVMRAGHFVMYDASYFVKYCDNLKIIYISSKGKVNW